MNYHLACSSTLLCSFLATGCSTHAIKQTNEVSTTAIIYTDTINNLLALTTQLVIQMDSKQLALGLTGKDKKQKLIQKNKAIEEWMQAADQLHDQNVLLQKYFKALQAMVDSPLRNDMSQTLGSVSKTISAINDTQAIKHGKSDRNRELSYTQSDYVSSLSLSMISSHYAGKVKQALVRDKDVIGKQIALQAKQLDLISSIYKRRSFMDSSDHYVNKVEGPFVSKSPKNFFEVESWTQDRLKWFNRKDALKVFVDVQEANKAFSEAWVNILQGKRDIGSIKATLSDVNSFIHTAYELDDSIKNPRPGPYLVIQPTVH